jgi:hypothetical protein
MLCPRLANSNLDTTLALERQNLRVGDPAAPARRRLGSTQDDWPDMCSLRSGAFWRAKEVLMLLALFVVLLVLWMLGFFAFHVAGGLIHLLLIIAVIALVVHLFRGRTA